VIDGDTESALPAKTARMLLRLIRAAQPVSKIELARRLGLNRATVTTALKPYLASGLLREDAVQPVVRSRRNVGRPPIGLSFATDREFFVGINIGVRRSQVGITTAGGEVLEDEDFDTPPGHRDALALIRASVDRLCDKSGGRTLKVIGVSVPGPADNERKRLLYAPRLDWRNVAIEEQLRSGTQSRIKAYKDVRIVVENDATAAALYEAKLRLRRATGPTTDDFVLVRAGTGIGVGLVLGGEMYRGKGGGEGIAGEFGHMTIVARGKPCFCGNRGCWERYASASAASLLYVGDRVRLGAQQAPHYVEIVGRAEAGEVRAQRTLERIGEYLGIGIANVIAGLGVPHVILGGRIVFGWKFIRDPLYATVEQSMAGRITGWMVEPGEPRGSGLGGALEVAVEEFLTSGALR
jgi:predicted NBD/HSP70 family sugar kinase/DNA-binding transcriptional ArsR family regulator